MTAVMRKYAIGPPFEDRYQHLLHDRDSIFAAHFDESVSRLGMEVFKSAPRSASASAICERVIGIIERECLESNICAPQFYGTRMPIHYREKFTCTTGNRSCVIVPSAYKKYRT